MLNQLPLLGEGWAAASCAHIATLADRRRDRAVGATIPAVPWRAYPTGGSVVLAPGAIADALLEQIIKAFLFNH